MYPLATQRRLISNIVFGVTNNLAHNKRGVALM